MESTKLSQTFKDVETAIRYILAHYPNTRNNDKLLMLTYWELIDKIQIPKTFRYDFLTYATPPETIRRMRQKIQAEGDYQPSEEVKTKRHKLKEAYRQALKGQKTLL